VQLEDAQAASQATSLSQKVPTSQDETPFPSWDPSPERRPRSNGVSSNYSHTNILMDVAEDVHR
jgi:hypothetical protein